MQVGAELTFFGFAFHGGDDLAAPWAHRHRVHAAVAHVILCLLPSAIMVMFGFFVSDP